MVKKEVDKDLYSPPYVSREVRVEDNLSSSFFDFDITIARTKANAGEDWGFSLNYTEAKSLVKQLKKKMELMMKNGTTSRKNTKTR